MLATITDVIIMREALYIVRKKLINVIAELKDFAMKYRNMPTLAFTHFQPAQPTTVGKRAALWLNELIMDLDDVNYIISQLKVFVRQRYNRYTGKFPGAL